MRFSKVIVAAALLLSVSPIVTEAASYPAGSATYRQGGSLNSLNHGGVRKSSSYVYEIKGYDYTVQLSSDSSFKNDSTYYGNYGNPSVTSSQRDSILSTSEALRDNNSLTYTMYDQINWESNSGSYINVSEITDIRCDGVIEYAYEWNNVWVWGKSDTGGSGGKPQHYDVTYIPYAKEHADLGGDQPWKEVSPIVQRGANAGCDCDESKWTKLRKYY